MYENTPPVTTAKKTITQVVVFLCIVMVVMTAVRLQRNVQHLEQSANARIAKEQQALIAEIGEFMLLPADEVPTIATVTNKQKLRNQPIFADAENGDTLIAYPIAGKLILYRETQKQIITIASIHE